jgi:aminoglycoside phosphotransferase (APT) family kinase protein
MQAVSRVQQLLEELIDPEATPEKVCRAFPELLPEVRARWRQMCRARDELDAMFPPRPTPDTVAPLRQDNGLLPRITGYEVEAVLGQGGVGVVFRARNLRLGRPVALKMLRAGAYAGPTELARFQREAETVASLSHPNIVQIYEVGDHEGQPYFTMEFVDGGNLAQKLTATPPPVRWAAELVASLAEAVAVANGVGIVHRDLKPANILLTADGTPKISDFGLARRLEGENALTWTGTAVGTPSYMAPEQASGTAGPVGPSADVYGLGAVLYELLTGRPPFRGGTALETFRKVLADQPIPPSRLNTLVLRDLETVCLKCLQKEPQSRYSSAAALAEDLRRYLFGQVVLARPVGDVERVGKWIRRNPAVASLSATAVLALVGGTVVSLLFARQAGQKADIATQQASELKEQAIELASQTRAAKEYAREAEENLKKRDRTFLAGLMIPVGRNPNQLLFPLDATEAEALHQLRGATPDLRMQFLETAFGDPRSVLRVGRRADWVAQAIVGCDRGLRSDVASLVARRIQEPGESSELKFTCARLGVALNLNDRVWAEQSADAFLVALRDPKIEQVDFPVLAEGFAAVCERLPPTQSADRAASALDICFRSLRGKDRTSNYSSHSQAIVSIGPLLDEAAARRAAGELTTFLCESGYNQHHMVPFSQALLAVCRRLPPGDGAAYFNRSIDFILERRTSSSIERARTNYTNIAGALGALSIQLEPDRASRAADALLTMLSDSYLVGTYKYEYISDRPLAKALTQVAEHLDAPASLRVVESLIGALRNADNIITNQDDLKPTLSALIRRLDAAGSARAAELLTAAARDPKTSLLVRTLFPEALAALVGRISPDQATALETAAIDSLVQGLTETKGRSSSLVPPVALRGYLGQALATICKRPGATGCTQAADALGAAIRDRETPLVALPDLATALMVVSAQLPPKDSAARMKKTLDLMDTLWEARTAFQERGSIAEAMVAAWTCLEASAAAARAQQIAAYLEDALLDSRSTKEDMIRLAPALAAVYKHVRPAEGSGRKHTVADIVSAMMNKTQKLATAHLFNSQVLTLLCPHLDSAGAVRTADAILTIVDTPPIFPNTPGPIPLQFPTAFMDLIQPNDVLLKQVSLRLNERELQHLLDHPLAVGRHQRVILDVLGGAKNRSFRTTWDYLDWIESNGNGVLLPQSPTDIRNYRRYKTRT